MKADIKADIEKLFDKLNAQSFIPSPGDTVSILIFAITEKVIKKYIKPIIKDSERYVQNVLGTKNEKEL